MLAVILRTIKDRKNSIIMFVSMGVGLLWLYVAMFPFFSDLGNEFVEFWSSLEGASQVIPITSEIFSSLENFLAMEQYSIMLPLLMIFMLLGIAAYSLSADIEFGTAEILLSRPMSRMKLFFSRYLTGVIVLIIFVALTSLMIVPFAQLHNQEYDLSKFISISIILFLFGLAVFSLAMLISAIFSEKSKVNLIMGGGIVGMYILNIIATTNDKFEFLQYLTFFYYYDYNAAIIQNEITAGNIVLFSAVTIVATTLGAWWYNKRDIAV